MIRVFLIDGALQALLQTDFGQDSCTRHDYLIDDTDTPVYFEVTAGENAYTIESWIRDNSAAKMHTYGEKIELLYGQNIDSREEGPAGTQKVFAGVARQLDRYFNKTGFLKNNTIPNLEDGGVLLSYAGQVFNAKVVTGDDRPDMKCFMAAALVQGKTQIEMARPYKDEIMKIIRAKMGFRD